MRCSHHHHCKNITQLRSRTARAARVAKTMHKTSEQLKKQEEMVERQEAMRRKTAEIEAELRTKTELAKTRAEAEGRIRQERENHDLILQKVRLEAVEQRDTVLKAIADGGKLLGEGLSSYLRDGEKLRNTAFIVSLAAAGIYSAKTGAGIAGRFIEVSRFYRAGGGARSMHTPFSPRARIHRRSVSHDIR